VTGGLGDKAKDFLGSDKGEQVSDKALDKAGQVADQKTGGTHDAQIDKGRDLADGKIGNE
jgi:MT0933-like antitoxin protein